MLLLLADIHVSCTQCFKLEKKIKVSTFFSAIYIVLYSIILHLCPCVVVKSIRMRILCQQQDKQKNKNFIFISFFVNILNISLVFWNFIPVFWFKFCILILYMLSISRIFKWTENFYRDAFFACFFYVHHCR